MSIKDKFGSRINAFLTLVFQKKEDIECWFKDRMMSLHEGVRVESAILVTGARFRWIKDTWNRIIPIVALREN